LGVAVKPPPGRWVGVDRVGNESVVYDPCSGDTYAAVDWSPMPGRRRVSEHFLVRLRQAHPATFQRQMPVSLCWSPVVRCNLSCPHCLDDKSLSSLEEQGRRRIAEILAESDVVGIDISGGEPLLLGDLDELLEVLRGGDRVVSLTTNGWRLASRAERLAGRVDALRVSFDGADAASHDRWRGAGSFAKAVEGARAAVEAGIPLQLQTVLMRDTAAQLPQVLDLASTLGASGLTVLQFLPIGEGAAIAQSQMLSDDDARLWVEKIADRGMPVRLRTRDSAGGFTVVRADGLIWRNEPGAGEIGAVRQLRSPADLRISDRDGSA
jgi:MoaA/NifB/PqqE/SkfB family radical SAM enzyme